MPDSDYTSIEDGPKVFNNIPNAPSIYSISSDKVFYSTHGYSRLTSTEVISLRVKTDTARTYAITSSLFNNFDPTSISQLE